MSISQNYPLVNPSLSLDFANTKKLDPRITFSRPTTGAYYDGKTVALAEQNLLLQSQTFETSWTKTRSSIAINTTIAPDGTTTADTLIEDVSSSTTHGMSQSTVALANQNYTFSVFAKANERTFCYLGVSSGTQVVGTQGFGAFFDLTNGTVSDTTDSAVSASIVSVGNGWYRCILTQQATGGTYAPFIGLSSSGIFGGQSYTGDGTSGIFLWGAQLEQRSQATAYSVTTTQPITNYIPTLLSAPANVARFDHNPVTGESLGLLVEEQRTNLVLRSEEFDNASWLKGNGTITSNTVVALDGTLTGDKLVENTANGQHYVQQTITVSSGVAYTASCYVKAGERNRVNIFISQSSSPFTIHAQVNVDLLTGTIIDGSGIVTSVGNGWYRISVTGTSSSTGEFFRISTISTGTTTSYTGDGYSGIYIWQAQLEAGAFATSPIKTVASQVTRSTDSASMTGANFSSWYRQDQGTLYAEGVSASGGSGNQMIASIGDGAAAQNQVSMYKSGAALLQLISSSGATQSNLNSGLVAASNTNYKFSTAYKVNDFAFSVNANTVATDTSGQVPAVVNKLDIGNWHVSATSPWNSTIKKIAYYPTRLTNTQLQALTS